MVTTEPAEFHSPVQRAEETEHDSTVCDLNTQCTVKERESNTGVDCRKDSLGCETCLVCEVDHSTGCTQIGECPSKSENEVRCGNRAGNGFGNTKLQSSNLSRVILST